MKLNMMLVTFRIVGEWEGGGIVECVDCYDQIYIFRFSYNLVDLSVFLACFLFYFLFSNIS